MFTTHCLNNSSAVFDRSLCFAGSQCLSGCVELCVLVLCGVVRFSLDLFLT